VYEISFSKMESSIFRESGEYDVSDVPTIPMSEMSLVWHESALELSRKLVECAKIKRRCTDVFDADGSEQAFKLAWELQNLSTILKALPVVSSEPAAKIRRVCIDRIVDVYNESLPLLELIPKDYLQVG
jgi:hypothetical protein